MKIKIIGSGTILSGKKRNPSGYLLTVNDGYILLDIGAGIMRQLIAAPIDILKIKAIIISHFHSDHCADLLPFLLRRNLLNNFSNSGLAIYGPKGIKDWFNGQIVMQGEWITKNPPLIYEFENEPLTVENIKISAIVNGHTQNSVSLLFAGDKNLFYSSDTDYNEDLIPLIKKADLAIMECSLPDDDYVAGHLTPRTLGALAEKAALKEMVVSHIYPQNDTDDLKERIAAHYSGEIIIAEDFMEIDL